MSLRVLHALSGNAGSEGAPALALSVQRMLESCGTSIARAWCTPVQQPGGLSRVVLQRSQKDPANGASRRTLQSFSFEPINGVWASGGPPVGLAKDVISVAPSPSGATLAIVRCEDLGKTSPRVTVELWCSETGALLRSLLADEATFGAALGADGSLSDGLVWSPCERYSAFVSAMPSGLPLTPTGGVFAARAVLTDRAAAAIAADKTPTSVPSVTIAGKAADVEASCREDWGEKFPGVSSTRIAIVDWASGTVRALPGAPSTPVAAAGSPVFVTHHMGATAIVYVGFTASPRRLGLASCNNRPSQLFLAHITESDAGTPHAPITPANVFARSARASPDGSSLAFLAASVAGTVFHSAAAELGIIDLKNELPTAVMHASAASGIYAASLPHQPWAPNARSVFVNTQNGSRNVIVRVFLDGRAAGTAVEEIFAPNLAPWNESYQGPAASSFFHGAVRHGDGDDDVICLVTASSPSSPERFGYVSSSSPHDDTALRRAVPGPEVRALPYLAAPHLAEESAATSLGELCFRTLLTHPTPESITSDVDAAPFESILLWSRAAEKVARDKGLPGLPLLVMPHGGPHAAFSLSMVPSHAIYASLGYAVLAVNYRGSTGYGDGALSSLPGRAGRADVSDVFQATLHALTLGGNALALSSIATAKSNARVESGSIQVPRLDAKRVGVVGGSHGGFLGAHLISNPGTRPLYRAALLRNPVTNIASMASSTDIPDWCWATVFGANGLREGARPPTLTRDALCAMFDASPVALAAHARLRGGNYDAADAVQKAPRDHLGAAPSQALGFSPVSLNRDVALAGAKLAGIAIDSEEAINIATHAACISTRDDGAAILIMLGGKDRRVPPSQGFEFFYTLRERSANPSDALRVLVYDNDGHALDGAATEGDVLVTSAEFLAKWV